jgi:competence protein ComEC
MIKFPAFYRYPFAYLSSFLMMGIIFNFFYASKELSLLLPSLAVFTGLIFFVLKKFLHRYFLIFIAVAFMAIGYSALETYNSTHFEEAKSQGVLVLRVDEFQKKETWSKGVAQVCRLENNLLKATNKRIVFYAQTNQEINKYDVIQVATSLFPIENKNNPGDFDLQLFWKSKGIKEMCFFQEDDFQFLDKVPNNPIFDFIAGLNVTFTKILDRYLDGDELAIGTALILGDKSFLDAEIRNAFTATGAMHALAVSGLHVGIILPIFLGFFKLFSSIIRRKQAVIIVIVILWIYALMTGFSPSVIRAVFMFSVLALAQIMGRSYNPINTLFFTAFVLLIFQPLYLFDIGFQLSYIAMLGIFTFNKKVSNWVQTKNKIFKFFWEGTAVGLSAQFMTVPLSLYYFHQFPNYFALANLGIMLFSGVILGAGIALFAFSFIPIVNAFIGFVLFLSIYLMFQFLVWIEQLPGAVAYGFSFSFLTTIIITFVLFLVVNQLPRTRIWKASAVSFLLILGFIVYQRYENLEAKHICVFNNNQLLIAVKNKSQIVCFYDTPIEKLDKVKFTVSSYLKNYPGEVKYVSIHKKNANLKIDGQQLSITKTKQGRVLAIDSTKYTIHYSNKNQISQNDIAMPWVENEQSLSSGARIIELK